MATSGMLVEVQVLARGSAATAAVATGGTVVPVEDVTQFDAAGGTLSIDGTPYDYTSVDEDASTLTLASPLTVDVVEFDPVLVMAGGQVVQDWTAVVDLGGEGDTVSVPIPYGLRSVLGEGQYDPPVPVDVADNLLTVLDVPGRTPVIDGTMIDPDTLPPPADPVDPPESSPTLSVQALSDMLLVTASDVDPTTTIDYHISTTPGFVPDSTTLAASTRSTVLAVNELPDGTPLAKNITYALVAVASNVAGSAAPSPEVDATLSDAGVTITADNVVGGSFTSAYDLTGSLKVGNISITPGSPTEPGGLLIPLSSGGVIQFPADGSPATIQAHVDILSGTVTDHLTINGPNNDVSGKVTLNSTPTAPTKAPTVYTQTLRTDGDFQKTGSLGKAALSTLPGALVVTSTAWVFLAVDRTDPSKVKVPVMSVDRTTGAVSTLQADLLALLNLSSAGKVSSIATDGSSWYVLYASTASSQQYVTVLNSNWTLHTTYNAGSSWSANGATALTYDAANQNVVIVGYPQTGTHAGMFTTTVRNAADGTFAKENYWGGDSTPVVSVIVGACDFGAPRMVVLLSNGWFGVFAHPLDANPIAEYPNNCVMLSLQPNGLAWVPDLGRFVMLMASAANTYDIRLVSSNTTAVNHSVGWTQYCSGTRTGSTGPYETKLSPTVTYTMAPRVFWMLSTPAPADGGNPNDPDSARLYVDNKLKATLPDTGSMAYIMEVPATGAASPTTEGFVSATGGSLGTIQSQAVGVDGKPAIQLKGDGSSKIGGASTPIAGTGGIQFGSAVVSMGGGASATGHIDFPNAFGSPPMVFVNLATAVGNKLVPGVNSGTPPTTTGFDWTIKTGDGTTSNASPTLYWFAIGAA